VQKPFLIWYVNYFNFKDAASPHMEHLLFFHNSLKSILLGVLIVVSGGLYFRWFISNIRLKTLENVSLEIVWTVIPAIILLGIGFPSLTLLYSEFPDFSSPLTYTIFGHQWYWRFCAEEEQDGFMAKRLCFRNLEVDNSLKALLGVPIRFLVSSADVIHRFSLPAFAVKVDAVPGRINEAFCFPSSLGKFYGQCSEICGANHSFMPVSLEIIEV
jgi:cytochrome c oxidase subunit 2